MQKIFTRSIPNQDAMRQLAEDLCKNHFPKNAPFTVFLEGTLGAGKTFLAKEILKLNGVTEEITSPTYALVNEYQSNGRLICHWDFYRLELPNDFFARGFQDLSGDPHSSHLVEWPERLNEEEKSAFNGQKFKLHIDFGETPEQRNIQLSKSS